MDSAIDRMAASSLPSVLLLNLILRMLNFVAPDGFSLISLAVQPAVFLGVQ